jgi:primosomal protein N' (replication factor Y)
VHTRTLALPEHSLKLQLAVPAPLRKTFDYLPPEGVPEDALAPGMRLRVPLGRRSVTAILTAVTAADGDAGHALRAAEALLDDEPLLDPQLLALGEWAARYYQHPIGEVLTTGIPKSLRSGRPLPLDGWRLSTRGRGLPPGALARARRQAQVVAALQAQPVLGATALREAGASSSVLRELEKKGLIERCRLPTRRADTRSAHAGPALSDEQRDAVAALAGRRGFHTHLLEGVTGSGKTEVYLQLIAACLERGEQALVLVPEIGLTPQTLARFRDRFHGSIAVLHSGLADGERCSAWLAARDGSAGIVIGTRSAVFTPMARPGLIVVDEEHDGSFKQQDGFRYSARDVAVKRAQLAGCPVLLGSATPALETLDNALRGRYGHSRLRGRAGGGALPSLHSIDLRGLPLQAGVSRPLLDALRECTDERGDQALLFLNRRGYAPTLLCHSCGWVAGCEHCDARLTVHLRRGQLRCHHCMARSPLPAACPQCQGQLLTRGLGTEQIEAFLRESLQCAVHRIDSDSMRGREAAQALFELTAAGEPCVLLGTQMLTKGHHFPRVQLVGVIDADALLYSADFRGEERLAQLVVQVAGRAGRERSGGQVLLQTHHPEHPLLQGLIAGGYDAVVPQLLAARRETGLPPAGQLSMLRCDSRGERDGEAFLQRLRGEVEGALPLGARLIGPLPSSLPRRAGRFRWQLWCLCESRRTAQVAAATLVQTAENLPRRSGLNWFLDVDAQDVL